MESFASFFAAVFALSVGVERVVEIIKGYSAWLREHREGDPRGEGRRKAALQMLAVVVGGLMAYWIGPSHFVGGLNGAVLTTEAALGLALLLGFMASGGSALWNNAIEIVRAIKTVKESATPRKTEAAPAPLPLPVAGRLG